MNRDYHLSWITNVVHLSKISFVFCLWETAFECGAHVQTVGAGRNRRNIDQLFKRNLCVCVIEHPQWTTHDGGLTFIRKYHLGVIKLNAEQIKELKIGG